MYDPVEICAQRIVDTRLDLLVFEVLPEPQASKIHTVEDRMDYTDEIVVYKVKYGFTYCATGSRSRDMRRMITELMYGSDTVQLGIEIIHTPLTEVHFTLSGLGSVWYEVMSHFRLAMHHPRAHKWRHVGP